ncbi:fructose-1,6-bisphosphatase [uncultured Brachyspira sp.]|uniref:fructose-1,6-bisphosphatase n=1 Tax=uncultured Brachyspira sp. TaxID=221953 RepID=UPI0025D7C1D7|nr:fructose-1,6-bisphosphatase [uncultured Brachyspira sp.]
MRDKDYLELLSRKYPTIDDASVEIINLKAISKLPKGTEYFLSDIHGESDGFEYLIGTSSGVIREKIELLFKNTLPEYDRVELQILIVDTKNLINKKSVNADFADWCRITIYRLIRICKLVTSKYTRSKIRKKMPPNFAYILDELLQTDSEENKENYYFSIIDAIIEVSAADKFILALCQLIRQCSVDRLHIAGDIYDRGPHPDKVMDNIMMFNDVDIAWGNHDIHWMGAAKGSLICVANAVRLAIRYNNFDLLEYSYGINLRSLSSFANDIYKDDPCEVFKPKTLDKNIYDEVDKDLAAKMHKAISIIQFKLECQLIKRHPNYEMDERILLDKIDYDKGTISINNKTYELKDKYFPTIDRNNPFELTDGENTLIQTLAFSFMNSQTLQRHINYIYAKGGIYKIFNGNLIYHGCIPTREDGSFDDVYIDNQYLSGRKYLNQAEDKVRKAFYSEQGSEEQLNALDYCWYLWCGPKSPLFGKNKMTTFEKYFIDNEEVNKEHYNPYYYHIDCKEYCQNILREFELDIKKSHIINGHVPVKTHKGESPIKGGGILLVIDGGLSKAYHKNTGIGGYTLISNSNMMMIAEHRPFTEVAESGFKLTPKSIIVEIFVKRITVGETDIGNQLEKRIKDLSELLNAYRNGIVKEKVN